MSQAEARWLAIAAKSATDHLELGSRAAAARRCRGDRVRAGRASLRVGVARDAAAVGTAAARRSTVQRGDEAPRWAEVRCRSQEWGHVYPKAWARRPARSSGCSRASAPELQGARCSWPRPATGQSRQWAAPLPPPMRLPHFPTIHDHCAQVDAGLDSTPHRRNRAPGSARTAAEGCH